MLLVTGNILLAQNTRPEITGQVPDPVIIDEDQPLEMMISYLSIADPEDTSFTLQVYEGANYTVAGAQITPSPGYNGSLEVQVTVFDGTDYSNSYGFRVQVNPVNDAPVITGQALSLQVAEDNPIDIPIGALTFEDPEPATHTLIILDGATYTFSATQVTPIANFNGTIIVNVQISDGELTSNIFGLQVEVIPVNDVPQITGQTPFPLSTQEEQAIAIVPEYLSVSDPDDIYPADFLVNISPGSNYSLAGNVVTPAQDFSGLLAVPVSVFDGESASETYNLQIQVIPVNDVPVITGQATALSTNEDTGITLQVSHLSITDSDDTYPGDFTLIVHAGSNYTISGQTVTPFVNFTGTLYIPVTVSDGESSSEAFSLQLQVLPVNDPPAILSQHAISIDEGQSFNLTLSYLFVDDPDNIYPAGFSLTIYPGSTYTVSGLTITPLTGFTGTLSVPVQVSDGSLTSNIFNLQIQVATSNSAPVITGQVPLSVIEDQPILIDFSYLVVTDADDAYPAGFSIIILPGNNYTATGRTVTPAANFTGVLSVNVQVNDGLANSAPFALQITVSGINDPPTLDVISNMSVQEDSEVQSIVLTGISAGLSESQVLTVTASANNPDLLEVFELIYQTPQASGILRMEPRQDVYGTSVITVTVTDDGGASVTRTFNLTVISVNDAPVFTSSPVTLASVGEIYQYNISVTDADPSDRVTVTAPQKPSWLTLISGDGILNINGTPPAGSEGSSVVVLEARDAAGALARQEFILEVNTKPVVTDFIINVEEDSPFTFSEEFSNAYADAEGQSLEKIIIVALPKNGSLSLNTQPVIEGAEIIASDLSALQYLPYPDFFGNDSLQWNGSDGISVAATAANLFISIAPVNDPPEIISLDTTVLNYHIENGPVLISSEFEVADADGDNLVSAEVGFRRQNFVSGEDILTFEPTASIQGSFDQTAGILFLSGSAPVAEYNEVIRSIRYENISSAYIEDHLLKTIFYTLSDGQGFSETRDKVIKVIDSFTELEIPNGFTPDNREPNDTWRIKNIQLYPDAIVRVYNASGSLVFSSTGYEKEWDGILDGQPLPVDTYYYTIDLNLQFRKKNYKGSVTILR